MTLNRRRRYPFQPKHRLQWVLLQRHPSSGTRLVARFKESGDAMRHSTLFNASPAANTFHLTAIVQHDPYGRITR